MFDTMIETRKGGAKARAIWPYPVAASMHFLVVGGMVAASLLILNKAPDFENPFLTVLTPGPHGPGLPPLKGEGGPPGGAAVVVKQRPAEPVAITQPRDVPGAPASPDAPQDEIEEAVPGVSGLYTGLPGLGSGSGTGWPWGVPDGFPDGSGDGLLPGNGRVEPKGPPEPVELTPDMVPPVLVTRVQPEYPPMAITARLPGFVVLQAVVGEDGGVLDVTVLSSSSPIFVRSAVDAVKQWKYRPALQSGRPVRVYFTVRVDFRLK